MTQPLTLDEWTSFRANLRSRLREHLGRSLKPGIRPDAWTPAEVLHHVLLVDASTADLMERLASRAGNPGPRGTEPWPVRAELMDFPLDTAFSVPAFRGTEPKRSISTKALDSLEKEVGTRLASLAAKASARTLDDVAFPHPLAGKLNFYEWLVFGGVHERLHLTQLENDLSR